LTEFLDVYPTLCELAGLPIPDHVQGKSLVPLMRGETEKLHEAAISQMSPGAKKGVMGWTLRTPRYRYIEWRKAKLDGENPVFSGEVLATELYDYDKDPLERENVADQPAYAKVLQEHQTLFDRLLPHLPKRKR
jgi:arylsulfatase A-like enzyme